MIRVRTNLTLIILGFGCLSLLLVFSRGRQDQQAVRKQHTTIIFSSQLASCLRSFRWKAELFLFIDAKVYKRNYPFSYSIEKPYLEYAACLTFID